MNPILLAGQVHGGVVQGIGQALTEDTVYGEDGQLLTASFMDYAMPRADDVPFFHFETRNVPSTTNALGIKGAGEAGTIGASPAAHQRRDRCALPRLRHHHIDMPATPEVVWGAIQDATYGRLRSRIRSPLPSQACGGIRGAPRGPAARGIREGTALPCPDHHSPFAGVAFKVGPSSSSR